MTRVALIGAGAMGRNHARVYREVPGAELVGVADVDSATAARVGGLYEVPAFDDHVELLDRLRPEAVSVAVPTQMHWAVVKDALERGCHVLVEKPIAATLDEARYLVALANDVGRVLTVGHIERFNPAIVELKRRLVDGELGRVFQIHARRLGPFPSRIRDVGVVVDLATHDLDIMRHLTASEAERVYAETRRHVHSSNEDLLNGIVRFTNDVVGVLEINWLTPTKIRELCVTGDRGMFRADYLTQDLFFYENADARGVAWNALTVLRGVSEGSMTRFALPKAEPLRAEIEAFLASVRGSNHSLVSGNDGVAALELALALIESSRTHGTVDPRRVSVSSIA